MKHLPANDPGFPVIDERRAFVSAASAVSRLDEAIRRSPELSELHRATELRREAIAIVAIEGAAVRPESIIRILSDPDATMLDRGARSALDAHNGLALSTAWQDEVNANRIEILFKASDASTARLYRPDTAWSLEDDCAAAADECARVAETPEPWTAIEAVRRIWTSGRFFGRARRMALTMAPWLISKGFHCSVRPLGIADRVRRQTDRFREAEHDPEAWSILLATTLREAADDGLNNLGRLEGLLTSLHLLCPAMRSSSSVDDAIKLFIESPINSAKRVSDHLDLSPRGTKVVLDKLIAAGVIEVEGGARNRKFVCRRAMV